MTIPAIPLAAVMIASTVVSTGLSVMGQMQTRRRQEAQREAELAAATASATANYDQINLRRSQEREAAGQQLFENQLDALEARSRFEVAAGEAGVAGPSVEATLRDLYGREGRFQDSVATNLENTSLALSNQGVQVRNQTQSAINSAVQPQPVDWLGAAGNLVSGVSGAMMADRRIGRAGGATLFS